MFPPGIEHLRLVALWKKEKTTTTPNPTMTSTATNSSIKPSPPTSTATINTKVYWSCEDSKAGVSNRVFKQDEK